MNKANAIHTIQLSLNLSIPHSFSFYSHSLLKLQTLITLFPQQILPSFYTSIHWSVEVNQLLVQ